MFINGLFKSSFFDRAGGFQEQFPNIEPPTTGARVEDVIPFAEVTKTSTGTGDWNVAGTWNPSGVPGANDKVRIQPGHTVTVKGNNTAKVEWCRVEGTLNFDTAADSKLTVGTLVILDGGAWNIGTRASPLSSSYTAELVIADLGALDLTKDTWKLGRGILTDGTCEIKLYGAAKTPFVKLGSDMATSATSATLASTPTGWAVGDEVVLGADNYDGWRRAEGYLRTQDEERTLTSHDATSIGWTGGTTYTHASPSGRSDLKPVVANLTRNIRVYTENPTGVPDDSGNTNGLRGHWMVRSGCTFDIRYVEIRDFGRTNKRQATIEAFDQLKDGGVMATTTNVNGRYGLHFHFNGVEDANVLNPPKVFGCVVAGSASNGYIPGWGFVQHGSAGNWWGNVTYYTWGSGFIAEEGTERGIWRDCLALTSRGSSIQPTKISAVDYDDAGRNGSGFFVTSRYVRLVGCKAVSCNFGFDLFHRVQDINTRFVDVANTEIPPLFYTGDGGSTQKIKIGNPSVRHWDDLEAIGCSSGLHVEKASPSWPNEKQTILTDFTYWNRIGPPDNSVCAGADFQYTGGYVIDGFDIVNVKCPGQPYGKGINIGQNSQLFAIQNSTVNGAYKGIVFPDTDKHTSTVSSYQGNGVYLAYNNTISNVTESNTAGGYFRESTKYPDEVTIVTTPAESAFALTGTTATEAEGSNALTSFSGAVTDFYGDIDWGVAYREGSVTALAADYAGSFTDGAVSKVFAPMMWTDRGRLTDHMEVLEITRKSFYSTGTSGAINDPSNPPTISGTKTASVTALTSASDISATTIDLSTVVTAGSVSAGSLFYFVNSTDNAQIVNDDTTGSISYTPDVGWTGTDTFKFWVWDGQANIVEGTCTVTVS